MFLHSDFRQPLSSHWAIVKKAAAIANKEIGVLKEEYALAISQAADRVIAD